MLLLTLYSVYPLRVTLFATRWLQQCLALLLDRLHLESLLHDFQVFVAALQMLLRGTYVLCQVLCQAENCTHNVLGVKS